MHGAGGVHISKKYEKNVAFLFALHIFLALTYDYA